MPYPELRYASTGLSTFSSYGAIYQAIIHKPQSVFVYNFRRKTSP
jgi:hypothetical protein